MEEEQELDEKHICPDCKDEFSREQRLESHLEKDIPCTKKCRVCNLQLRTAAAYKKHLKASHALEWNQFLARKAERHEAKEKKQKEKMKKAKMAAKKAKPSKPTTAKVLPKRVVIEKTEKALDIVPLKYGSEPGDLIEYIPIEDFNWKYLESISDRVERSERCYENVSMKGTHLKHTKGYEQITELEINVKKAADSIDEGIREQVLKALEGTFDLEDLVMNVMTSVHAERSRPHLMTIRAKDVIRGSVNIYTRPPPTKQCYWIVNSCDYAMDKIRKHCMQLFLFVMQISINMLIPVKLDDENDSRFCQVGYTMQSSSDLQSVITINSETKQIVVRKIEKDKLDIFAPNKPKPADDVADLELLNCRIRESQENLMAELKAVEIPDERFRHFLEHAKDASIGYEIKES